jgi:hypothetical protein
MVNFKKWKDVAKKITNPQNKNTGNKSTINMIEDKVYENIKVQVIKEIEDTKKLHREYLNKVKLYYRDPLDHKDKDILNEDSSNEDSSNVNIKILKNTLKNVLITNKKKIDDVLNDIDRNIQNVANKQKVANNQHCEITENIWTNCEKECFDTLTKYLNVEINSISYMLRLLNESYISSNESDKSKSYPFKFKLNNISNKDYINNIWGEINKNNILDIEMEYTEYKEITQNKSSATSKEYDVYLYKINKGNEDIKNKIKNDGRLIMGFGPSASGKTHCAKSIIKLLKSLEGDFPTVFFTVDGGIAREQSIIYKYIINLLNIYGISGFNNMKMSGLNLTGKGSMFNSSSIKNEVESYLTKLKKSISKNNNNNLKFNLYIPETLGYCGIKDCKKKYQKYIDLTNNEIGWIGLYIWQHNLGSIECNYISKYKCVGCTQSGMKREVQEGKKYSNSQYYTSEKNGLYEVINNAPIKFKIHNSGTINNQSIIEDLNGSTYVEKIIPLLKKQTTECIYTFQQPLENFVYINEKSKLDFSKKVKHLENVEESYSQKYLKYKYKYMKLKKTLSS